MIREVSRLAWPAIAQSLLATLVFLVDRVMLGRHSAASLGSMQISANYVWAITSTLGALTVGVIAVIGRASGAGDRARASAALRAALMVSLVFGALAALATTLTLPLLLSLFGSAGAEVLSEADGYLRVILPSLPILLVAAAAAAAFHASGDTRTPLAVAAAGNVVNVLVNRVLIFGMSLPMVGTIAPMGARGAAIGSVAAMAIEAVVLIALLGRASAPITFRGRGGERAELSRISRVSGPAVAERVIQHVGYQGYVVMIGALGATAMTANQALLGSEAVCFLSADGFGIAAAALVSARLGRERPEEAAQGARVAMWMGVALLSAFALLFLAIPEALASIFCPEAEVLEVAVPCMRIAAIAQPFMAVAIVLAQALRGAGDTRATFAVTVLGGFAVRLPATYVCCFVLEWGLAGAWVASTLDWVVRTLAVLTLFAAGAWKRRAV